ncbi:PH domain-containing protein [Evansella cellulosilytica]|uniref:Membrane-flanked domain n=1 Tax=Evansella cellulosilytica (strain ATCC 21833 / DSM 2522 / FERM P-1141 / JCM 9156 / N-4) TaxID=649639 RepID=E6U077_EVAC2|nr:PH domain-containing protein [Evansella cellulosilytica]ADU30193.1 membrane-flanked domain [Evansella cellulosilytica DSM 2522]
MNEWRRQHSIAIFFGFLGSLKELIFTFIAIFIFGQSSQIGGPFFYSVFFSIVLVSTLILGVIKWWTFKYQLNEQELQIKQGLIFKKNRYIRKERIQSIDIQAKLLQRLFNLVELRIETAGGGAEPEFRIVALKKEEARFIKEQLLINDKEDEEFEMIHEEESFTDEMFEEENNDHSFHWALSKKRLIIAALTSSGIGIVATFIAAIVSQAQQFIPDTFYEYFFGWIMHSSIIYIGFIVLFILLIAWFISIGNTILKYGMFRIETKGDEVHISRGVLERRQLTLSANRITAVRIVQNLFRQPFGYAAVYVESAGGGSAEEDLSTILIPLCKKKEVNDIIQHIIPSFVVEREYEKLPRKSLRRYMIKLLLPSLILAAIVTYLLPYGWLSFILPFFAILLGIMQYYDAGIGISKQLLLIKSRKISLSEVIIPRNRIQSMSSSQSILQRFDDLHTIHVAILSSISGKNFSLRHISGGQREKGFHWYSYESNNKK